MAPPALPLGGTISSLSHSTPKRTFRYERHGPVSDVPLADGTDDDGYLDALDRHLPRTIAQFDPDFVLYQAGVDVHAEDKLGRLALTSQGLLRRDTYVIEAVRSRDLPVASSLGGGYGPDPHEVGERHARSMIACARANAAFARSASDSLHDVIG